MPFRMCYGKYAPPRPFRGRNCLWQEQNLPLMRRFTGRQTNSQPYVINRNSCTVSGLLRRSRTLEPMPDTSFPVTTNWTPPSPDLDPEPSHEWQHGSIDHAQFADAFRHGYAMTLRFLLSRGAAGDAAEEIAQAAWAKGWECRMQLQRPHMVGAWVNSIAKNMLKNSLRADRKREILTEHVKFDAPAVLALDLKHILKKCDPRSSIILRGYYFEGYTTEEIAEQVGLTPVTVRVRLLRLRRALRSQLLPVAKAA